MKRVGQPEPSKKTILSSVISYQFDNQMNPEIKDACVHTKVPIKLARGSKRWRRQHTEAAGDNPRHHSCKEGSCKVGVEMGVGVRMGRGM